MPGVEGPEQFLWRGRLWKVRAVLAHWVETGPWWQSPAVRAVIGSDEAGRARRRGRLRAAPAPPTCSVERELWRVEAGRGRDAAGGVFDLSFDWDAGSLAARRLRGLRRE